MLLAFIKANGQLYINNGFLDGDTIYTCNDLFLDSGGEISNYSNDEDYTITFCSCAASSLSITFQQYASENTDTLKVYDGASIFSPEFIQSPLSGNPTVPIRFLSFDTCITFRFISNSLNSYPGWKAEICADINPPISSCKDTTVYLDETGIVIIDSTYIDAGSTDDCGINYFSLSKDTFRCDNVGNNMITVELFDISNKSSTCLSNIYVRDTISPVALCKDTTVYLDKDGLFEIDSSFIDNGSFDGCSIMSMSLSQTKFDCSSTGINTINMNIIDMNNNDNSCQSNVLVKDTISPQATCKDTIVYLDTDGKYIIDQTFINDDSKDACGISSLVLSKTSFDCSSVGENNIYLDVTDSHGNVNTCQSNVRVIDTIKPVVLCTDTTIYLDPTGVFSIDSSYIDVGSFDPCDLDSMALTLAKFDCSHVESNNNVTLAVYDAYGNNSSCTVTVYVKDTLDPRISCKDTTIYLNKDGYIIIDSSFIDNGSFDECGISNMQVSQTNFDCSHVGNNVIQMQVNDFNGNNSSCNVNVTILDTLKPTTLCKDTTIFLDPDGLFTINPSFIDAGSQDACGIADITLDQSNFDCSHVGMNKVVLTVTDLHANSSSCEAIITVQDTITPIVLCKDTVLYLNEPATLTIDSSYLDNGSWDNCGINKMSISKSTFNCLDLNAIQEVTLDAWDVNGNQGSCVSNVLILDTLAPIAICQNISLQLDTASGKANLLPGDVDNGSYDNCSISSLSLDKTEFTCHDIGLNTVQFKVIDASGNEATCESLVNVEYEKIPEFYYSHTIDTICNNTSPDFRLSSNLSSASFQWRVTSPSSISGWIENAHSSPAIINHTLTNSSDTAQILLYEVTPFAYTCAQKDTTLGVWVEPNLVSHILPIYDTLCNFSTSAIDIGIPFVTANNARQRYSVFTDPGLEVFAGGSTNNLPVSYQIIDSLSNADTLLQNAYFVVSPYTVDESNNEVCTGTPDTATITIAPTIRVNASSDTVFGGTNISCKNSFDGEISLDVKGGYASTGYKYSWSTGDVTKNISNLGPGTYNVSVQDDLGCMEKDTIELTEPDPIDLTLTIVNNGCHGTSIGAIDLEVSGGSYQYPYTYKWIGSNNFTSMEKDISNLYQGFYTVFVKDTNSCENQGSVVLSNDPINATLVPSLYNNESKDIHISCHGYDDGFIIVNPILYGHGNPDDFEYEWTGPGGFSDTLRHIFNLEAGTYNLVITDTLGCKSELITFTMNEPDPLLVNSTTSKYYNDYEIRCHNEQNGTIDLNVNGGHSNYFYSWSTLDGWGIQNNSPNQLGLSAGTYSVIVHDSTKYGNKACFDTLEFILRKPGNLELLDTNISLYNGYNVSCHGLTDGFIKDINITGGSGSLEYNWTSLDGTGINPSSLNQFSISAGTYHLRVSYHENTCDSSWTFVLNQPDSITISYSSPTYMGGNEIRCHGESNGQISVTVSGGDTNLYNYYWTGNDFSTADTNFISNLQAGAYTLKVNTGAKNFCEDSITILLKEPVELSPNFVVENTSCKSTQDGSIQISISGGTPGYEYSWLDGYTGRQLENLSPGWYAISIKDTNNCYHLDSVEVREPEPLVIFSEPVMQYNGQAISCAGNSDGAIKSIALGGSGNKTFTYIQGTDTLDETSGFISGLPASTYQVIAVDEKFCRDDTIIEITEPTSVTAEWSMKIPSCHNGNDGLIEIFSSGGTSPYSYQWQDGQTEKTALSLTSGTYNVRVIDANSCVFDTTIIMNDPPEMKINYTIQPPLCPGINDGTIEIGVEGGIAPYYYEWSDYSTTPIQVDLHEGKYEVTITDENGCQKKDAIPLVSTRKHCLFIPNVFTPNGDGSNDTWEIDNMYLYPDAVIEVYDRWGQLVFVSDPGYNQQWDGSQNGKKLPVDSYHYVIDLKKYSSSPVIGNITILYGK